MDDGRYEPDKKKSRCIQFAENSSLPTRSNYDLVILKKKKGGAEEHCFAVK